MIPRILHRCVPEVVPDQYEAYWRAWCALHPTWDHMTHQDPLTPSLWPLTARAWPACHHGAQLAGLVRLEAIYRHGGIFLDWDVRPVGRSLEILLDVDGGAFVGWEDAEHIPDAVFGAEPGHPGVRECLDAAVEITLAGGGPWAAAVGVFTDVWTRRPDVTRLPPEAFFPVHYTDRPGSRSFQPEAGDGVLGVHEWAWSWGPNQD